MDVENQSDTQLEKLREILRRAANLASEDENDKNQMHEELLDKLKSVWNELSNRTKKASEPSSASAMEELLTELKVLETSNSLLGKCIREFNVTTGRKFSSDHYATKLLAKLTADDEIDWMILANDCTRIINRAPGVRLLLGTFDVLGMRAMSSKKIPLKKQKVVQRELSMESEKMETDHPDEIQNMEADPNSVDAKVANIMNVLHRCCKENNGNPISFYKFVLHPSNFTTTVENIFHLSFIIRDGLARLDTIGDEIVIEPVKMDDIQSKQSDSSGHTSSGPTLASKYQMVFSISFAEWKNLVKICDIQKSLLG